MSFIDTISAWWKAEQKNWALLPVEPPDVPQLPSALAHGTTISPHSAYVTVRMRSMAIANTRIGWNRFHAAVYTQASLGLRDGNTAKLESVLSPDFLRNLDPKRLQNVLQIDRTIFGPVPYIGTPISFETGVFAVKHADLAAPFLTTLTDLASVAGVALVSAAKPFVDSIKNGVDLLTGAQDATSLEVALTRELQPPHTGWYALIRQPASSTPSATLSIDANNFELLNEGQSMGGIPYLVFSIDGHTVRDDWAQIPDLKAAYADFFKAVNDNNQQGARSAVDLFARRARVSPELLRTHGDDVAKALDAEFLRIFPAAVTASPRATLEGSPNVSDALSSLKVAFRSPS
jgi:hypothetical protein